MTGELARAERRTAPRGAPGHTAWLVLAPRRPALGRAVQRPRARADDGVAHALRAATVAGLAPTYSPPSSTTPGSCGACARTTRRARSARRCSTSGLAGIGNLWKVEGCSRRGRPLAPDRNRHRRGGDRIVDACRPRMQQSALDGNQTRFRRIYGRARQPCPRCGPAAVSGSAARATTTGRRTGARVPGAEMPVGHKGADVSRPGNTLASFDAALEARRRHDRVRRPPGGPRRPGDSRLCSPTTTAPTCAPRPRWTKGSPIRLVARSRAWSSTWTSRARLRGAGLDALRRHGLLERSLVTSQYMRSLVGGAPARAGVAARLVRPGVRPRLHRVAAAAPARLRGIFHVRRRLPRGRPSSWAPAAATR